MSLKYITCVFLLQLIVEISALPSKGELNIVENGEKNWLHCKKERVVDNRSIWNQTLYSIADVTVNDTEGDSTNFHFNIGVIGDNGVHILLSREPILNRTGFYYVIEMTKTVAKLYCLGTGIFSYTHFNIGFSYDHTTGISIKLLNGKLMLSRDNSDTAFFEHRESDISAMKYFGFEAFDNLRGYATFLYDC